MSFEKKFIATALTGAMIATSITSASALQLNIEKMPDGGETIIKSVVDAGLMSVYKDGTFHPNEVMQRQKMARFVDAALKYRKASLAGYDTSKDYSSLLSDVKEGDFYYPFIASMYDKGVIKGYADKTFKGKNTVTRGEALAMMVRAYSLLEEMEIPDYKSNPSLISSTHRYSDVPTSNGFYNVIYHALSKGWIKDFSQFRVNDTITKYEIAVLIHRILLENGTATKDTSSTEVVKFYKGTKVNLVSSTLSSGGDNVLKLKVLNPVQMGDTIALIGKDKIALKANDTVIPKENIVKITLLSRDGRNVEYGIVIKNYTLTPGVKVVFSYDDDHVMIPTSEFIVGSSSTEDNTNTGSTTGALTFTLGSNTNKFVPRNATNVEMLNVDVNAEADSLIKQITVSRSGLGNAGDIKALKLFINGVQAGSERTLNFSTNSTTFYVPMEQQKVNKGRNTVTIKADFNGVAGSYSKILINGMGDINAGGTVGGSFPLMGGEVQTAGVEAGSVNLTNYAGAGGTYYIGDKNKEFGKFDLAATSVEGVVVKSIRMRAMGTAKVSDVGNLKLFTNDGKEVSKVATVTNDGYANFDLVVANEPGLTLNRGEMKTLFVKGDVVTGRSDSTIGFEVENPSDVNAEGSTYHFGVPVQRTSSSQSIIPYSIKGGKLSAALHTGTGTIRDVAPRTSNVEIANFNFTTQGDSVRLKGLKIALTATDKHSSYPNANANEIAKVSNLESVKIIVGNNSFTYGPFDLPQPTADVTYTKASHGIDGVNRAPSSLQNNGTDTRIISIDDYIHLPANTTTPIRVVANFSSTASKGDAYQAHLVLTRQDGSLVFSGENEATREQIRNTDITPSGASSVIHGNNITINTANLTASLRALPGSKSVAKSAKNVELFGFTLSAGSVTDLKIRGIKLSRDSDMPLSSINDIESLQLYANGHLVSGLNPKTLVSGSPDYVMFDSLTSGSGTSDTLVLKGGQQLDFVVKANISQNAQIGNSGRFYIADVNDLDIVDMNGNSLSNSQKQFGDTAINSTTNTQAPVYTIQQGGVTVSLDNSSPVAGQLTAGDKEQKVFSFRVSARNEDIYIRTLKLKVNGTPGNVYKLSLDNNGQSVGGGTRTVVAGVSTWNLVGNDRIKIAAGTDAIINVKAEVMTSENSIAQSGKEFSIGFENADSIMVESEVGDSQQVIGFKGTTTKSTTTLQDGIVANQSKITMSAPQATWVAGDILRINNEEVLIIQKVSETEYGVIRGINGTTPTSHLAGANVTAFDGSRYDEVKGNNFTVYYVKPVSITAENLPTTTLQVGQEQVIGAFQFRASKNVDATVNKLAIKKLRVKVAGNVHVSNPKLYNKSDSSVAVNGVVTDAGKTLTFDLSGMSNGKNEINEDTAQTFEIKGLINYVPAGGTLSLNINDIMGDNFTDSDIVWSDGVGDYATVKINVDAVNGRVMTTNSTTPGGTPIY